MRIHRNDDVYIVDPAQPTQERERTCDLMEAQLDLGPCGTQVICRGWTWAEDRTRITLISTDN